MLALVLAMFALLAPKQHAMAAPGPASTTAKPGARVSLYVDVTPDAGVHVYAPGAKDYQPVALTVAPHDGTTPGAVVYPKAETMSFDGETVPVFQKPFRLAIDVTVGRAVKPGTKLALSGRIDYQACDDKVCFIPASLPVSWTIDVK